MSHIEEILVRVEQGTATVEDAEALRQALALMAVRRVSRCSLQRRVYDAVAARGYVDGWLPQRLIERQVIKALEELGEVARYVFDGRIPPAGELADVVIPLLVAAETAGYDLGTAILDKVQRDVQRGVRA